MDLFGYRKLSKLLNTAGVGSLIELASYPPDTFAILARYLEWTGDYVHVLAHSGNSINDRLDQTWRDQIRTTGRSWQDSLDQGDALPPELLSRFDAIKATAGPQDFLFHIISLFALADEACSELGLSGNGHVRISPTRPLYSYRANQLLRATGSLSTLPHQDFGKVLPRMQVPQRGASCKNLSHHVVVVQGETRVTWWAMDWRRIEQSPKLEDGETFDVLVIPYPWDRTQTEITADDGYFGIRPVGSPPWDSFRRILRKCPKAMFVVLPEGALTPDQFDELNQIVATINPRAHLLSGVSNAEGLNAAYFSPSGTRDVLIQHKHHRWAATTATLNSYGASIAGNDLVWERHAMSERRVHFFSCDGYLLTSFLICEDITRTEPAQKFIVDVGPQLLFALLADSAQIPERWSGKAAATMADQNGVATLSCTSIAYLQPGKSRSIALFTDHNGKTQSFERQNSRALIVTLKTNTRTQTTIDGRGDDGACGVVEYDTHRWVR